MSWFWGLLQMTLSIKIKKLKNHRVFNLVAPFATEWRKGGGFWGLAPFATEWRKGSQSCPVTHLLSISDFVLSFLASSFISSRNLHSCFSGNL
jgi:hypothetical protein